MKIRESWTMGQILGQCLEGLACAHGPALKTDPPCTIRGKNPIDK